MEFQQIEMHYICLMVFGLKSIKLNYFFKYFRFLLKLIIVWFVINSRGPGVTVFSSLVFDVGPFLLSLLSSFLLFSHDSAI